MGNLFYELHSDVARLYRVVKNFSRGVRFFPHTFLIFGITSLALSCTCFFSQYPINLQQLAAEIGVEAGHQTMQELFSESGMKYFHLLNQTKASDAKVAEGLFQSTAKVLKEGDPWLDIFDMQQMIIQLIINIRRFNLRFKYIKKLCFIH